MPQQPLTELFLNVLQRFDRRAGCIRQAHAGLNGGQLDDRRDIARRVADGGVRPDRTLCRQQLGCAAYGILSVLGSCGVAVPEQPVRCELDQRVGQLRYS